MCCGAGSLLRRVPPACIFFFNISPAMDLYPFCALSIAFCMLTALEKPDLLTPVGRGVLGSTSPAFKVAIGTAFGFKFDFPVERMAPCPRAGKFPFDFGAFVFCGRRSFVGIFCGLTMAFIGFLVDALTLPPAADLLLEVPFLDFIDSDED